MSGILKNNYKTVEFVNFSQPLCSAFFKDIREIFKDEFEIIMMQKNNS